MLAFAATCVEAVARRLGVSYRDAYERMKHANVFSAQIFPYYEVMHTESRDVIADRIIETL